jgi:hypothetical protein
MASLARAHISKLVADFVAYLVGDLRNGTTRAYSEGSEALLKAALGWSSPRPRNNRGPRTAVISRCHPPGLAGSSATRSLLPNVIVSR